MFVVQRRSIRGGSRMPVVEEAAVEVVELEAIEVMEVNVWETARKTSRMIQHRRVWRSGVVVPCCR